MGKEKFFGNAMDETQGVSGAAAGWAGAVGAARDNVSPTRRRDAPEAVCL